MKLVLALLITLLAGTAAYTQQIVGKPYTYSTSAEKLDLNKLYYKGTGKKVDEKDFRKLFQENPRFNIEREFDAKGNVVRYLIDPTDQGSSSRTILKTKLSNKEAVPDFELTTIEGKKLKLSNLKGKVVILRFELATDYRFRKSDIAELDKKINALADKDKVEAILLFGCSEEEVRQGFDLKDSNFELVANGQNFIAKYGIFRFPTTLLIDQEGKLIENYPSSDDIILEKYLH